MTNYMKRIYLETVKEEELTVLKKELQESFMEGLRYNFPDAEDPTEMGPIPSEEDLKQSLYSEETVVYQLVKNHQRIGGVVLRIDEKTNRNEVELFYIKKGMHGKGLGIKAWKAIEEAYPKTRVWELYTPYFEKRNIHFYVNKCGFHIVEFNNKHNPGPNVVDKEIMSDKEYEFFRFEKLMIRTNGDEK